jgi:hypothetical protein
VLREEVLGVVDYRPQGNQPVEVANPLGPPTGVGVCAACQAGYRGRSIGKTKGSLKRSGTLPARTCATWSALAPCTWGSWVALAAVSRLLCLQVRRARIAWPELEDAGDLAVGEILDVVQ